MSKKSSRRRSTPATPRKAELHRAVAYLAGAAGGSSEAGAAEMAAEARFRRLTAIASWGAIAVAAVGLAIFVSWMTGKVPTLTGRIQAPVPNAGLALALLGIGVWLILPSPGRTEEARVGAFAAGLGVLALMLASGTQGMVGADLGINSALVDVTVGESLGGEPGEMASITVATLFAASLALVVRSIGAGRTAAVATDTLGLAVIAASFVSILGYLYGLEAREQLLQMTPMALEGAIPLLALGLLCLTLSGPEGIVGDLFFGPSMTSALVRRLAIPGVIGMVVMSVAFDSLQRLDVIDQQLRLAGLTLAGCIGFILLCYSTGWRMEKVIYGQQAHMADLSLAVQTDYLTGLPNRQAFDEQLAIELNVARRGPEPLCVMMIDVVGLKAINDNLGHEAGDHALQEVAGFLSSNLRGSDVVTRWGGDEFAALCPGGSAAHLATTAERLREGPASVAGLRIGVAELRPGDTSESLMARADSALIREKQSRPGYRERLSAAELEEWAPSQGA